MAILLAELHKLERKIGIKDGFFDRLIEDDDWSFIIKLNAVIETSLSMVLTEMFTKSIKRYSPTIQKNVDFTDVFYKMQTGNEKQGKLNFVKACGILDDKSINKVIYLASIRNRLAHDIKNVNFNLLEYYNSLSNDQKKQFIEHVDITGILTKHQVFKGRKDNYQFSSNDNGLLRLWLLLGFQSILIRLDIVHTFVNDMDQKMDEDDRLARGMRFLRSRLLSNLKGK